MKNLIASRIGLSIGYNVGYMSRTQHETLKLV
jgi:hypothetical protein